MTNRHAERRLLEDEGSKKGRGFDTFYELGSFFNLTGVSCSDTLIRFLYPSSSSWPRQIPKSERAYDKSCYFWTWMFDIHIIHAHLTFNVHTVLPHSLNKFSLGKERDIRSMGSFQYVLFYMKWRAETGRWTVSDNAHIHRYILLGTFVYA